MCYYLNILLTKNALEHVHLDDEFVQISPIEVNRR